MVCSVLAGRVEAVQGNEWQGAHHKVEAGHARARGDSSKALAPRSGLLKLSHNGSLGSGVQRLPRCQIQSAPDLVGFPRQQS